MTKDDLISALRNENVRAFLTMLRLGEGTKGPDGYRTMFGGELFENNYADHPRRPVRRGTLVSTAAGAYQFLERTWDALVKQYGFADFSPANQDLGGVALIAGRGALADVIAGRFDVAVAKCAKEWASLPGSPYGQPTVTLARALEEYEACGGRHDLDTVPTNPLGIPFALMSDPADRIVSPAPVAKPAVIRQIPWLDVLRVGHMVTDPTTWKTRVGLTMFLSLVIGIVAQIAKGRGYAFAEYLDQDTITAIAGGVASAVGLWGTYATSDKVGVLPPRSEPDRNTEDTMRAGG